MRKFQVKFMPRETMEYLSNHDVVVDAPSAIEAKDKALNQANLDAEDYHIEVESIK